MSDKGNSQIGRRQATLRISSAALAVAGVGTGTLALLERRVANAAGPRIRDWRLPAPADRGLAVAARGDDSASNVRRAIAALGGMEAFVRRGETVLLKPNVGWDRLPEQAANTDPQVVAAYLGEQME